MKKLIVFISIYLIFNSVNFASGKKEEQKYTFTVATVTVDTHIQGRALKEYGNRLSEKTKGNIEFRIFYSGQLGKSESLRDAVIKGNVDIMNEGLGLYSSFQPVFDLLEAFYSFKSVDHFKQVLNKPGSLEYFENLTLKNPGVRILYLYGGI